MQHTVCLSVVRSVAHVSQIADFYTDSQRARTWAQWHAGDSLEQISQMFDRCHPSVQNILGETGGIRPAERRRGAKALTIAEREEIARV